ncbi:polyprenyl synthetase family protein [bacterium]|nr:polyprenyl synthetase family protein [bacterium]
MNLRDYLSAKKKIIDNELDKYMPRETEYPQIIHEAIRYSVFSGGKRLRPILMLAAGEMFSQEERKLLPAACAIELIHNYSLVHDDLPAMDDDEYRRGRLTSHKKFGEDIAILAGDALLTIAFEMLSEGGKDSKLALRVINLISKAIGTFGMIGGQVVDISWNKDKAELPELEFVCIHKTGALIAVSLRIGAILSGAAKREEKALYEYGKLIGVAFQITDDILDEKQDSKKGFNYPAFLGIEESEKRARDLVDKALMKLDIFGKRADILRQIAKFIIIERKE